MAKEQPRFLAVLPWLQLAEEIEVGPFIFWRWPKDREKYIPSEEIEAVTKTLVANFGRLDMSGKRWVVTSLDSLGIVNHKKRKLLFSENDFEQFGMAVDALCLSALFKTEIYRTPINSKNPRIRYIGFYKNYTDFNWHGIQLGTEVTSRHMRARYGNKLIGEVPPVPAIKPRECTNDKMGGVDSLLTSLGKLLESSRNAFTRRIFRALTQFNSAYTDYPLGSILADVVTLATAFEILLDIRKGKRTKELGDKIEELFSKNHHIKEPNTDKPWKVYWIRQCYKLRNNIVHGKKIQPEDLDWEANPYAGRHVEIAIYVFRLVLMKLLARNGLHEETEEDMFQADILDDFLSSDKYKNFPRKGSMEFTFWKMNKDQN